MNHDKIDMLLAKAGCRFEFLYGHDYEDFSPYVFAELIIEECRDAVLQVYHRTPLDYCGLLIDADDEIQMRFYGNA